MLLLAILSTIFFLSHGINGHGDVSGFDEAIIETWKNTALDLCSNPSSYFAADAVFSYRIRIGFDFINVEVRNLRPLLIRLVNFIPKNALQKLQNFHDKMEMEELRVVGSNGSYVSKYRRANGFWIQKEDNNMTEVFEKFRKVFLIDHKIAESFLMLSYDKNGHYAPHYDYIDAADAKEDYWFKNYGHRLATSLFIVKTADDGGGTVFPDLKVVISPNAGDVILWFNTDSNQKREDLSLHGACPIISGKKIAISLWIRSWPQRWLKCRKDGDASYQIGDIFKQQ